MNIITNDGSKECLNPISSFDQYSRIVLIDSLSLSPADCVVVLNDSHVMFQFKD